MSNLNSTKQRVEDALSWIGIAHYAIGITLCVLTERIIGSVFILCGCIYMATSIYVNTKYNIHIFGDAEKGRGDHA